MGERKEFLPLGERRKGSGKRRAVRRGEREKKGREGARGDLAPKS